MLRAPRRLIEAGNGWLHCGWSKLPNTRRAAVATTRLATDESIAPATFSNQPFQVEHRPALACCAVRRELVIVLVQGAKGVERDHCLAVSCHHVTSGFDAGEG